MPTLSQVMFSMDPLPILMGAGFLGMGFGQVITALARA